MQTLHVQLQQLECLFMHLHAEAYFSTRLLAADAMPHFQVLPFVEAFFVLCDARTSHLPQPEPGLLRAASSDLARTNSGASASASASFPTAGLLTPAPSGQLPQQQRAVLDAHLPFLR